MGAPSGAPFVYINSMEDWTDLFKKRPKDELGPPCPQNAVPLEKGELDPQDSNEKAQELLSKRFAKLRHKTLYINMEYEDAASSFRVAQSEFISSMFKYCYHKNLQAPFESVPQAEGSGQPEGEISPEMKELYRQVARQTHPDKTTGLNDKDISERTALYQEASDGKKIGDFEAILKVALELDITPMNLTSSYLDQMEEAASRISTKIRNMKEDIMWNWYYSPPEKQQKMFERLTKECKYKQDGTDT